MEYVRCALVTTHLDVSQKVLEIEDLSVLFSGRKAIELGERCSGSLECQ